MTDKLLSLYFAGLMLCFSCYSRADDELTLKLLVWDDYAPVKQVKLFEQYIFKKYNRRINLQVSYDFKPRNFFNALRSKRYDVIAISHNLIKDQGYDYINNGLILPVNLANIPNYEHIYDDLKYADYITENDQVYGVPLTSGPYGLYYNANRTNPPESWNVLWDPRFRYQYAISRDYYEVNVYITALSLGYSPEEMSDYSLLSRDPVFTDKLSLLAKNAGSFWHGVDRANDLRSMALATSWGFSMPALRREGENWQLASPKEGTPSWVDNYVIGHSLRDKPFLRRIAEEWLNYVLSAEYQMQVVVELNGSRPVNLNVQSTPKPQRNGSVDALNGVTQKELKLLWPVLSRRDRNGLRQLWRHALPQSHVGSLPAKPK